MKNRILIAMWLTHALCAGAADWPQYRGPNANGTVSDILSTTWPSAGPREIWRTPTTDGFSTFAVAGGKACTIVARTIEGVRQEVCLGLDAGTGKELWAAPIDFAKFDGGGDSGAPHNDGGDGPRSTPTIDGGRVYVLSGRLTVTCLDAGTGKQIWRRDLVKEHGGHNISWQNAASPLIDGNLIYICAGGSGQALLGIHKKTGLTVWKAENDQMTHATPVAATILGARQIIFFTQTGLVSVAPLTGKVLWRYAFPYKVSTAASPVVGGDIVYCSAGYGVGAGAAKITRQGDAFVATELWRKRNELVNHWSTPVFHDGYLYGLYGFKQWEEVPLKCIELATGKEMWSKDGFGQGGSILVGNQVLTLTENGDLVLVDAKPTAYNETARHKAVTGKCWNSPAFSDGRVYARSTKEGVCLDISGKTAIH